METSGARRTFPCFDEPALKATFDVILRHRNDQGYFAVSNMPVIAYQVKYAWWKPFLIQVYGAGFHSKR